MKLSLLTAGTLVSLSCFASSQDPCVDLYKAACQKLVSAPRKENPLDEAARKFKPELVDQYLKILTDPGNIYFRNIAEKAIQAPQCKSGPKECAQAVAEKMADLAKNRIWPDPVKPLSNPNLRDLDLLLKNGQFAIPAKEFEKKLSDHFRRPELENKIEQKLMRNIKAVLAAKIQELPIEKEMKRQLSSKINSITYVKNKCFDKEYVTVPDLFALNAQYDGFQNTFYVCNGMLIFKKSEEELLFVIAHELAHSVGPCNLQVSSISTNPVAYSVVSRDKADSQYHLSPLLKCLRSEESLATKTSRLDQFVAYLQHRPAFCGDDQADESVADWFATEVLADRLKTSSDPNDALDFISKNMRLLCSPQEKSLFGFDVHPNNDDRVNRLVASHPKIREVLSCSNTPQYAYCDGQTNKPTKTDPSVKQGSKKRDGVM